MSAAPILSTWGADLTPEDLGKLAARWITPELAGQAGIRRVDSMTGCQMFSRNGKNMSGVIIPNILPGEDHVREYRERLDNPDHEYRTDGSIRETNKYISPAGRPNLIYFPPGVTPETLQNTSLPVVITEGEFKALALARLACHKSDRWAFVPIATTGVWNWRGTIGKSTSASGKRVDVKGVIPDLDRIAWKDRAVIIAYDADSDKNSKVVAARGRLSAALMERGAIVGFLEWPIAEGKGIDDRLATVGPEKVLADIAAVRFGDWKTQLLRNIDGKLLSCYENVALFLENHPDWVGVLGFNEFTAGHVLLRQAPVPVKPGQDIEDHFDIEVVRWLERTAHMMVKPEMVRRVVDAIARKNSLHPIRDYLLSLPAWDRVSRIGTWLIDYCGVESSDNQPNTYAMAVGEKFLISAVARILEPGCKADHILILEGPQGIGKSKTARTLAGAEWFSDQLADMGSKDASLQLRGCWILELSELDALNRSEMSRAKAFISQQTDRFRPPYGHRVTELPRQCVFIGTTNSSTWLKDETGGRRFWPVRCRSIDLERLAEDRDQLWAEALHKYRAGIRWWLEDADLIKEAADEQSARYVEDVWQEKVVEYAETLADLIISGTKACSVSIPEILQRMGIEVPRQDQAAANRVARCLQRAGWERKRIGPRSEREWRYQKPSVSQ